MFQPQVSSISGNQDAGTGITQSACLMKVCHYQIKVRLRQSEVKIFEAKYHPFVRSTSGSFIVLFIC